MAPVAVEASVPVAAKAAVHGSPMAKLASKIPPAVGEFRKMTCPTPLPRRSLQIVALTGAWLSILVEDFGLSFTDWVEKDQDAVDPTQCRQLGGAVPTPRQDATFRPSKDLAVVNIARLYAEKTRIKTTNGEV